MDKSNQKDSSQSIRALIESVAVKKQQELEPKPSKQDYEDVTVFMIELFAKHKTRYFSEDEIIPSLKRDLRFSDRRSNETEKIDRIGMEGRDAILSVLKEKQMLNEFYPKCVKKNNDGDIVLIDENKDQSGIFSSFIEYNSDLPVYRYATRDELYMNKLLTENNDPSGQDDQNDLQSPD